MYLWRKLSDKQRGELLKFRLSNKYPWHTPRHTEGWNGRYLLTAACYEHRNIIGLNPARMDNLSERLLKTLGSHCEEIYAWCVLPNHYHVLVLTRKLKDLFQTSAFCTDGLPFNGTVRTMNVGAKFGLIARKQE
jgi:putative transposase